MVCLHKAHRALVACLHITPHVHVVCLPQRLYSLHDPTPLLWYWQPVQMEALGFTVQRQVVQPEPPAALPPTFSSTATANGSCSILGSLAIVVFPQQMASMFTGRRGMRE